MTLTDDEVQRQIQIMVSFIEQEAKEKAEEIDTKAEEEFQLEKGKIVESQRRKIREYYEKKDKQLNQHKLVQHSHMLNKNRLQILKARDDEIDKIIDTTKSSLVSKKDDEDLLTGLIVQALLQAIEPNVTLRCLESQQKLIKSLAPKAAKDYSELTGKQVEITVDEAKYLTADKIGGIILITKKNRLTIDNTILARVDLVSRQLLPEVRNMLFGVNTNRKFMD